MNYIDKINSRVEGLDVGKPIFEMHVAESVIRLSGQQWSPDLDDNDWYNLLVNKSCNRTFNKERKEYYIDKDATVGRIKHDVIRSITEIFKKCSPAKEPKRTKAYRNFRAIIEENRSTIDFINSIFDVAEFFYSVTKTESIKHPKNDVHRKNIYQLLCLMEKSYGKAKTNSN